MNTSKANHVDSNASHTWVRVRRFVERNLAIAAFLTWACFALLLSRQCNLTSAGQFGDSFGTLNALFSSLAAVAAFKAYWSQRNQLIDQKNEFAAQRHESHLFFLMEELREAVRAVSYVDLMHDLKGNAFNEEFGGHRAICQLENTLLGIVDIRKPNIPLQRLSPSQLRPVSFLAKARFEMFDREAGRETVVPVKPGVTVAKEQPLIPCYSSRNLNLLLSLNVVAEQFNRFYEECAGAPLGNVFRLQAAILKYIDNPSIPEQQRVQHAELFKAQISDPELHLLLYYALSDIPRDNLRDIMSRYNILEALWRKKPQFIWHRIPEISYFETHAPLPPTD